MSSDASEVWSIESRKSDEQVELEIISKSLKKVKSRIPHVPQSTDFNVRLIDALRGLFRKGEIVWFSMDGSNWPCLVLSCYSCPNSLTKGYNGLVKNNNSHDGSRFSLCKNNIGEERNVQRSKIWKLWPGASVFKRNIFGRKMLKYSVSITKEDVQDSEDSLDSLDSLDSEVVTENTQSDKKRKIRINYRNQYDLLPLPQSEQALHNIWKFGSIKVESKLEKVDGGFVKPWLQKDIFPVPSDDVNRNLSLLQAIHSSCSWAIPEGCLKDLKDLESKSENNFSSFLSISIEYYRHGTEIIHVGDLVRLVTNLRQTRNVTSNQTTQVLYIASLNVVSQLSYYEDSNDKFWDHEILLYGLVHEPRGSGCVSTGEYRTVTTDGICGRWYSSLLNINRKMPAIEESTWVV